MKLLAGVHRADAGEIHLAGRVLDFGGPRDAVFAGIATIFQEPSRSSRTSQSPRTCSRTRTGSRRLSPSTRMREAARKVLEKRRECDLDSDPFCGDLTIAEQHLIEIAKGRGQTINARRHIRRAHSRAFDAPGCKSSSV